MNHTKAKIITYIPWFAKKAPKLNGITGYGRVNYWATSKKELREDLARCAAAGVKCYHIEYCGFADTDILVSGKTEKTRDMYKWLLKRCRALGMILFVSVVNDNMGSRKYGDQGVSLDKVYNKACNELEFIRKCGKANVLLQPVAETQTDAGRRFDEFAKAILKGWPLVFNGEGGRPDGTNGMAYRAVHPSSIANAGKYKGSIVSSDHGLIIRELAADGSLSGPGDPDKLHKFVEKALGASAPLVVYYAFTHQKHDRRAIEAMGR